MSLYSFDGGFVQRLVLALLLVAGLMVAVAANASPVTFDVTWTDGGSVQATGTITFSDASIFTTGGTCSNQPLATCNITAMNITVSGANAGNGTFNESDFFDAFIRVGGPLNINTNMVGQTVGVNTWDESGGGGSNEFNFRNAPSSRAPRRSGAFIWTTDAGGGTPLTLTYMIAQAAPAPAAVPTLSEWPQLLLALMVIGVAWHFHQTRESSY